VKKASGRTEAFYIIVRLKKPRRISYTCSDSGVRGSVPVAPVTINYDEVGTIESIDVGNGTSIVEAFASNATRPVLLRLRAIPATPWASEGNVFLIPQSVVGLKLTAAGWDPGPRYEALLSVIRSTDAPATQCSAQDAQKAEYGASTLSTWEQLFRSYQRYGQCDDGAISEGYSSSVATLLATKWSRLRDLISLIRTDSAFQTFVLRHVDDTMSHDQDVIIRNNVRRNCPRSATQFCAALSRRFTELDSGN
jgi:hypothetical protein